MHTTGEWRISDATVGPDEPIQIVVGNLTMCEVWPLGVDPAGRAEQLANAKAIAAIPQLLDAARDALRELNWCVDGVGRKGGEYEAARDKLRAILGEIDGQ